MSAGKPYPPHEITTTVRDLTQGVKALGVAVDALGMIAGFQNTQADWAEDALREIHYLMVGEKLPRHTTESLKDELARLRFDRALGESRR